MTSAHWTPLAAAQAPLFDWWNQPGRERHAFRYDVGMAVRSLCNEIRRTAALEREADAPFCEDCRAIVWSLTDTARDFVVDAEARTAHAMRENALSESELVAAHGGLPSDLGW